MFVTSTYLKKIPSMFDFTPSVQKLFSTKLERLRKIQMKREKKIILLMYVSLPYILFYFIIKVTQIINVVLKIENGQTF